MSKRLAKYQSTSISLNPLEDNLRIQEILKKLEEPGEMETRRKPKTRRLHGVITEPLQKPLILSASSQNLKKFAPRSENSPSVVGYGLVVQTFICILKNEFEMELARQIEEDQLKFVEDEKNPMKYVVENGLLFKQSRYSPLARVEIPGLPLKKKRRKSKVKKTKSTSSPIFRTNVFRGNINRQIPAIPLPSVSSQDPSVNGFDVFSHSPLPMESRLSPFKGKRMGAATSTDSAIDVAIRPWKPS